MRGAARRESCRHAGAELRLPRVSKLFRLALNHIDKLVLAQVRMMQRGHRTWRQAREVHTKILEAEQVTQWKLERPPISVANGSG
jgi:hypothetical protein